MGETAKANQLNIRMWMDLAETDPEKFEAMRAEAIERMIEAASEKRRSHLRRLQWRVDKVRERATTPMAATIAISEMMWDSFYKLHDSYQELVGNTRQLQPGQAKPAKTAQILPFRPATAEA